MGALYMPSSESVVLICVRGRAFSLLWHFLPLALFLLFHISFGSHFAWIFAFTPSLAIVSTSSFVGGEPSSDLSLKPSGRMSLDDTCSGDLW